MIRQVIHIDEEKCTGCGACAKACHEGAIGMVNGKAKLMRDDYCDGLGDCLPSCPAGAITFVKREAAAYDEAAVLAAKAEKQRHAEAPLPCGCPGSAAKTIQRSAECAVNNTVAPQESQLRQWPVQIKLVPLQAPYFDGADLLVAADCTAYAYANFHQEFIRGHITLVGCPKLDATDYSIKLTEILRNNNIRSVTVVRMEVPCCGGIEQAVRKAIQASGKCLPWSIVILSTDGRILERI
jgi:ferredoxin